MVDASKKTEIYKFSATWCQPCRQMAPLIEKMKTQFPDVVVIDCDIEKDAALAREFAIQSVPTLVTRSGAKLVGAVAETKLRAWFASLASYGL